MSVDARRERGPGRRTPEERPGFTCGFALEVEADGADGLDSGGTRGVPREHDVEVCEMALAEALVKGGDFIGCGSRAFELSVAGVVAWMVSRCIPHRRGDDSLKWTVLRAATSQPRACMAIVAILLPT